MVDTFSTYADYGKKQCILTFLKAVVIINIRHFYLDTTFFTFPYHQYHFPIIQISLFLFADATCNKKKFLSLPQSRNCRDLRLQSTNSNFCLIYVGQSYRISNHASKLTSLQLS